MEQRRQKIESSYIEHRSSRIQVTAEETRGRTLLHRTPGMSSSNKEQNAPASNTGLEELSSEVEELRSWAWSRGDKKSKAHALITGLRECR